MPPKGSKALNEKRKQIGLLASKKKAIPSMEQKLSELDKLINNLEHKLSRKRKRVEELNKSVNETKDVSQNVLFPILTTNAAKRRKKTLQTKTSVRNLDSEGEMKHLLQRKLSTVLQMKTLLLH